MLSEHPAIDQLHCIDKGWKKQGLKFHLGKEIALYKTLKRRKYDLVIHLTESWRGAILARWLKVPFAITRKYDSRTSKRWLKSFSHHYYAPAGNRRHTVDSHIDALRHLGLQPSKEERKLVVRAGSSAEQSLKPKLGDDSPYVLIHPTSRWLFKCWPEAKVAATINHLCSKQLKVVVTSAPAQQELDMVQRILQQVEHPVTDLSGKLSLKELIAAIDQAQLFIGVDSVPMHIASATQTPTVVLFGPSGDKEWGPWMNNAVTLTTDHGCRPCGKDGCGGSKISDCLTEISTNEVIQASETLLDPSTKN